MKKVTYKSAKRWFSREINKMEDNLEVLKRLRLYLEEREKVGDKDAPYHTVLHVDNNILSKPYVPGISDNDFGGHS